MPKIHARTNRKIKTGQMIPCVAHLVHLFETPFMLKTVTAIMQMILRAQIEQPIKKMSLTNFTKTTKTHSAKITTLTAIVA